MLCWQFGKLSLRFLFGFFEHKHVDGPRTVRGDRRLVREAFFSVHVERYGLSKLALAMAVGSILGPILSVNDLVPSITVDCPRTPYLRE